MRYSLCFLKRLFASTAFVLCACCSSGYSDDNITVAKVFEEWRRRELTIRSFQAEWKDSVSFPKAMQERAIRVFGTPGRRESSTKSPPGTMFSYDMKCSLLGDGKRLRYSDNIVWPANESEGTASARAITHLTTFNDKLFSALSSDEKISCPTGELKDSKISPHYHDHSLRPLLWWCRPTECALAGHIDPASVEFNQIGLNDRRCIQLVHRGAKVTEELFVDHERSYNVIRYISRISPDTIGSQIDITLMQVGTAWVPSGWIWVTHPKDDSRRTI